MRYFECDNCDSKYAPQLLVAPRTLDRGHAERKHWVRALALSRQCCAKCAGHHDLDTMPKQSRAVFPLISMDACLCVCVCVAFSHTLQDLGGEPVPDAQGRSSSDTTTHSGYQWLSQALALACVKYAVEEKPSQHTLTYCTRHWHWPSSRVITHVWGRVVGGGGCPAAALPSSSRGCARYLRSRPRSKFNDTRSRGLPTYRIRIELLWRRRVHICAHVQHCTLARRYCVIHILAYNYVIGASVCLHSTSARAVE